MWSHAGASPLVSVTTQVVVAPWVVEATAIPQWYQFLWWVVFTEVVAPLAGVGRLLTQLLLLRGGLLTCLLLLRCGADCLCGSCSLDGSKLHMWLLLLEQGQTSYLAAAHWMGVGCMQLLLLGWVGLHGGATPWI